MLVNAATSPGPALWQGLMMIAAIPFFFAATMKEGKYFKLATWVYVAIGVILFFVIICSDIK